MYITTDEVHQRIKSGLPPGSTLSQVNDFLKKQNWNGYPELREFNNFGTLDDMLTQEEKRNIKWYNVADIKPVKKTLFETRNILMNFYYDKEGKLVTYKLLNYEV